MDIKDSYLHGTVGVVKSIDVEADKLKYTLADKGNTHVEVTMPLATTTANGLLSNSDKLKLDSLITGTSYQKQVTVRSSTEVAYKKVIITKKDNDGYVIWIHGRKQHYLLNSGMQNGTSNLHTFWELGTSVNSTEVSSRGIRVKMIATSSSETVTLYIAMDAYTYFQVVSYGVITVEDSTKDIYDSITSDTTGWINCTTAKWTDTTYNVVTNTTNGLTPKIVKNSNPISNFSNDWVLTSTSGNTPVWKQLPYNAFNGLEITGTFNLANASALDIINIQNQLSNNQMRWYLISDSNGNLPSSNETKITVTDSAVKLLFGTTDDFGASVGDLMIVTKTVCKILPLNDAKAPSENFPGAMGLESPWDKIQINKIPLIESPSRTESNMNNALDQGVYPWCTLGRPEGATGAFTCIVRRSTNSDYNGYYTIDQIAYGREGELGQVYKRVIFQKSTDDIQYTDWVRIDRVNHVVSSSDNGLTPMLTTANTSTLTNSYYVLASSDGSNTPSWYKLPITAFSNDDTKVTQTNTTTSANYRVLLSGNADDNTETTTTRKSQNLHFNPNTGILTTRSISVTNQLIISNQTNGKHILFSRGENTDYPYNYIAAPTGGVIVILPNGINAQSTSGIHFDSSGIHPGTIKSYSLGTQYFKWDNVYASTLLGNLDGTYVNKLTGYTKATAIGNIATTDSLNTALGKLEFKTDFIYNDLIGGDNNAAVIDKWSEIKDFIAEIGNSTDITDAFVTRKTAQTITGQKTFNKSLIFVPSIDGGHAISIFNKNSMGDNKDKTTAGIGFLNSSGVFLGAYIGWGETPWVQANNLYINDSIFTYKTYNILHANNSSVSKSGETLTVKINGTTHSLTNTTYDALKNPNVIKFKDISGQDISYDGSELVDLTTGINCAATIKVTQCTPEKNTKLWDSITIDVFKVKIWDVYNDGGPSTYGNIIEINGIDEHWKPQLWFDSGTGQMRVRNKNFNKEEWNPWRIVLDSANYTNYTVTKTGEGASGNWNISALQTENALLYKLIYDNEADRENKGYLVKLNIKGTSNTMVDMHIEGNSYTSIYPIDTYVNFYNYNAEDRILYPSVLHNGKDLGEIKVFVYDGYVHVWFNKIDKFCTIKIKASTQTSSKNIVDSITFQEMPTEGVTRLQTISPKKSVVVGADNTLTSNNLWVIRSITKSLTLTTDWQDTGIVLDYTNFPDGTGTYAIQMSVNNISEGFYSSCFSGIFSVFAGITNSSNDADEIILHHNSRGTSHYIYLRTLPVSGNTANTKLQIACSKNCTNPINITFKFKKLI